MVPNRQRDEFVRQGQPASSPATDRPWIGVRFTCASAYVRVFRNRDGKAYMARCPRCGRSVNFAVGPGGTSERFFEVSC